MPRLLILGTSVIYILCGYQWEGLIAIPTQPDWYDLHPDMRCDECSAAAGLILEADTGPFKFDYER